MKETAHSTGTAADNNMNKLKAISDALNKQTKDVSDASYRLSQNMGGAGAGLRKQLEDLTKTFNEALNGINVVGETVSRRAGEASVASSRAMDDMESWGLSIKKGTDELTAASGKLANDAKEVSNTVARQTTELSQTSKQAVEITNALKQLVTKSGHEDFLSRMALVSEGLESIAIDINRIMETRITEEDWKRYSRGDNSVFLRKILGMRNKARLAKINQLYRSDSDFRNYVTRYLAQFDELIESARRSGQEGVLGASFMTSDAGKVYMILQSALAREFGGSISKGEEPDV